MTNINRRIFLKNTSLVTSGMIANSLVNYRALALANISLRLRSLLQSMERCVVIQTTE
jgi:hypothetical protein